MLQQLAKEMLLHYFAPIVIGVSKSSLADKFYLVLYAMYLDTAFTLQAFADFVAEFVQASSHLGVEFGLNRVDPIKVRSLFPWIRSDILELNFDQSDDSFAEPPEPCNPEVSLQKVLVGKTLQSKGLCPSALSSLFHT